MATSAGHQLLTEELEIEDRRVAHWRFDQFSLLGFHEDDAWLLSASDADLGRARSLAAAGCPLDLALRILV